MALVAFVAAGYLIHKKDSKLLWIPIIYFGLMEVLQAMTYFTIGSCTPANQVLTLLSALHIAFQPFFINAIALYFIPEHVRKRIYGWVFGLAFIATICILVRLYPFEWAGLCAIGTPLCGETLCSTLGKFHLAWDIPFNGLTGLLAYASTFGAFLLPLIYGSWKATTYSLVLGPGLAYLLTQNPNEWPAVWCLLSIALIIIIIIPPIREKFKVKKWYFWEYPFKKN